MKIIFLVLLIKISKVYSGNDDFVSGHDGYTAKLENLVGETINNDALSSLQFQPEILNFLQRSIGDPHNQVVILFNKHKNRSVYLGSITGSSPDFYSSYFDDKVIPPESNTTFKVVFLPRQLGESNSSLIIHTSFGVINYQMKGVGVECQYRLRPLIGIKLPINATISPEIQLYNPHEFTLQISEIYSSGGDFQLELPSVISGQEGDWKLWEIPPFSTKPIIRVRFTGVRAGNHTAYVRIKISGNPSMAEKMLVVPIEIEISNDTGLYSRNPIMDLGIIGLNDGLRRHVFNMLNSGQQSINIRSWGIESDNLDLQKSNCFTVEIKHVNGKNLSDRMSVDIDWSNCSNIPYAVRGKIVLSADKVWDDEIWRQEDVSYEIPFYGHVIKGNLSYNFNELLILRSEKKTYEIARHFILKNNYNVPLSITNLTVPESCTKYYKIMGFQPLTLQPGSSAKLLDIHPIMIINGANNKTTIEAQFKLITNISNYDIPVMSYTGLLRRIVPVDFARDGSQLDEKALNFGALLPVSKTSELLMAFVNENPVPIELKDWKGTITSGNGAAVILSHIKGCSKLTMDDLVLCKEVKPGEWAVFSVSVHSNVVGTFGGQFVVTTPFEEINTPVKFSTAMGRLELKSDLIFDDCFPGKICSLNLRAYSTFMKKMLVEGISVDMDGISYEFAVNDIGELPEIAPNHITDVGKLYFNPKAVLCKKNVNCYTSFDALQRVHGEMWLRSLNNYSLSSTWDNEKLLSQLTSFIEVKQSIKSMSFRLSTSQIRRHEFNATINFIWPRLLNTNVEFPFVQVNRLETKYIEIHNPSSQMLWVNLMLHDTKLHGPSVTVLAEALRDCPNCALSDENVFSFNISKRFIYMEEVHPHSHVKVGLNFLAKEPGTYSTVMYLRNNLTVVEAVWITARAVVPQFKFGNRRPGSQTSLMFEIGDKHLKLCDKKPQTYANVLITSKRSFTAKNHGEVPLIINGIRVEDNFCQGFGFKVFNCLSFALEPNESRKIEIAFSPDFTLARVVRTLHFDTSIGTSVNFTLLGTVAGHALEKCSKNIKRPLWEQDFKTNALLVLSVALLLVIMASVFDSDRILKDHVKMMAREKGPVQPPLDLRAIGLQANIVDEPNYAPTSTDRLNNLNNHHQNSTFNNTNVKKRPNGIKRNEVSPIESNGRFNINKQTWTDLRNKLTGTKTTTTTTPPTGTSTSAHNENTSKSSPKQQLTSAPRTLAEQKDQKVKTMEQQQLNSSSLKDNNNIKKQCEDDSVSSSSSSKENCETSPKLSKTTSGASTPPLSANRHTNKAVSNGKKSKIILNNVENVIPNQILKVLPSKAPVASVKPLVVPNRNQIIVAKEEKCKTQSSSSSSSSTCSNTKHNGDIKSYSPTCMSEGQQHHNLNFNNSDISDANSNCVETINLKVSSLFTYSDVVALSPVESKVNNMFSPMSGGGGGVNMMNGTAAGNRNRMAMDHGLSRGSSFNVKSDIFEQEILGFGPSVTSDLGPIGTKKSPSSTPIWEQFAPITKPSSMYSNNTINYEWNNAGNTPTSSNSYWSPAYRQQQPGLNSVTPGLRPPPGLIHSTQQQQQQQHQQQHAQNNQSNQTAAVMPAYDPFKSLKAIWAPNGGQNDADSWNN
ncbi:unnamed protein product [Diamesa serratosioi]